MADRLSVRILGCGSSGGVPRINGDWGACDPTNPHNRRSRCSILFRRWREGIGDPTCVIVDTSPDIRQQLLDAGVTRLDAAVLSHQHADQTHGLDDLRAFVLAQRARIPVYMDEPTAADMLSRFEYCFVGRSGYPAILEAKTVLMPGRPVAIDGPGGPIEFEPLLQDHGTGPSLGFRIGEFAYCNDVVRLPAETLERLNGLDTFIVDALREKLHPTHANLDQALAWIRELKPKNSWLTNLHIDLDYDRLVRILPEGVAPAHDGLELDIAV